MNNHKDIFATTKIPGLNHEHRISEIEQLPAIVVTPPNIDIDSLILGRTVYINTKSESLLLPKRRLKKYNITIPELKINLDYKPYKDGSISIPIKAPYSLKINYSILARVTAYDDIGNLNYTEKELITKNGYVEAPEIIEPTDMQIVYHRCENKVSVVTGEFKTKGMPDRHEYTEYKITRDVAGKDIVAQSEKVKQLHKYEFKDIMLATERVYYLWVRYWGRELNESDWTCIRFIPNKVKIVKPVIQSKKTAIQDLTRYSMWDYVNLPIEVSLIDTNTIALRKEDLISVSSKFETVGCEDRHFATFWKICNDPAGNDILYYERNTKDLTYHIFPFIEELQNGVPAYIFCKYQSSKFGTSEWSDPYMFTPQAGKIITPTIISPEVDEVITIISGIKIHTSEFLCQYYEDKYVNTEIKFCLDESGNGIVDQLVFTSNEYELPRANLDKIEDGKTYYIAIRQTGAILGKSDWSNSIPIVIHKATIDKPVLNIEKNLFMITDDISVTTSEFRTSYIVDNHIATEWKIERARGEIIYQNISTVDLESKLFTGIEFESDSKYYISARYKGEKLPWSEWSNPISIITLLGRTNRCNISVPRESDLIVANITGIEVLTSPYECSGDEDGCEHTEIKICSDVNGNNIVYQTYSYDESRCIIPARDLPSVLKDNTVYYLFARMIGVLYEPPEWSLPRTFSIVRAKMIRPEIINPVNNSELSPESFIKIIGSDFKTDIGKDLHIHTDWLISTDEAGEESVVYISFSKHLEEIDIQINNLELNTPYYAMCRYTGDLTGESEWSIPVKFTLVES